MSSVLLASSNCRLAITRPPAGAAAAGFATGGAPSVIATGCGAPLKAPAPPERWYSVTVGTRLRP